ncbi:replication protein [Azotobacter chroococcum]|uniref:Phage replication protein O n=1 Tax=Azotobacter chroococcum TaxID=353 RepID=A0A4R1PJL4_9GAMM|nr:replication protein [Azotobacter chroococcum]TBV95939.1 phage replication protein [Azotobacter chroococcum]TCL26846.1 phage replication protein O [Azotobacter chroococcum]
MTNIVQLRNTGGFTRMDNELYEALIGADLSGRELRVALAVHRFTAGYNTETARIPAATIASLANLARENVSRIIGELIRQRVLYRAGGSKAPIGISPVSEWKIDPKHEDKKAKPETTLSVKSDTSLVSFPTHIKDSKDINSLTGVVDAERQPEQQPAEVPEAKPVRQKSSMPACPHQAIVDLYHEILPELPAVAILNDTRKRHLQSRWRENAVHRDLDFWREYFGMVKASAFLTGKVAGRMGAKPFRASFDWLINASNFVKVVEGNYHA